LKIFRSKLNSTFVFSAVTDRSREYCPSRLNRMLAHKSASDVSEVQNV
jgi:hypothetical protein